MLVHDLSDMPVTILKLTVDTTNKTIEAIVFFTMLFIWIYMRLFMFPFKILGRLLEECYSASASVPGMNYQIMNMMVGFLCTLVALHVFWTYLMFKGMVRRMCGKR